MENRMTVETWTNCWRIIIGGVIVARLPVDLVREAMALFFMELEKGGRGLLARAPAVPPGQPVPARAAGDAGAAEDQ